MTTFKVQRDELDPNCVEVKIEGAQFSFKRDEAHELGEQILTVVKDIWDDVEIPCYEVSLEEYEKNFKGVLQKYKGKNFNVVDENGKVVFSCACQLKPLFF